MENPVSEIPTVIRLLTQAPPSLQQRAIERFFTPSAAFTHPFCRIWSFNGSRWVITKIFQWYKIMSPRIELEIHSIAFDEDNLKLYLSLSQIFSVWLIPLHVCPVTLTTVLDLTTEAGDASSLVDGGRRFYYIAKQEDLYQTSEFVKFVIPHFGHFLVVAVHAFATLVCVLGAVIFSPVTWLEEKGYIPGRAVKGGNLAYNMEKKLPDIRAM